MKKSILLGTIFGLASFSAFAADAPFEIPVVDAPSGGSYAGFVEVSVNASAYDYWGDSYNPWLGFGGAAALAYQLDDSMSIGLDLQTWSAGDAYYDGYYTTYGTIGALHLNMQQDNYSLGAFAGLFAHNDYYESGVDYDAILGVEGKVAPSDMIIVSAQLGVIKQLSGYYEMGALGFGSVEVALFPVENLKLSASIGGLIGQVGDDSGEDAKTLTYSLEAAYQFEGTPFSVFARYSGYQDYGNWDGYGGQTIKVGARFAFDGESLQSQAMRVNTVQNLDALSWLRLDGW